MIKSNIDISVPFRDKMRMTIQLVSQGKANPNAFPKGEIVVRPWDATVEEALLKGTTDLWKIVREVCQLNGSKEDDLYIGDANTILLVSRAIGFGQMLQFEPTCPHCKKQNQTDTVKIPDDLTKQGEKTPDWDGTDSITLPGSKDVVVFSPLRIRDDRKITQRDILEKNAVSDNMARELVTVISINGQKIDDKIFNSMLMELKQWYVAQNAQDQRYFSEKVAELHPRLSNEIAYQCDFCNEEFSLVLTFDTNFFRGIDPAKVQGKVAASNRIVPKR